MGFGTAGHISCRASENGRPLTPRPSLTLIVPAHDVVPYLRRCLESLTAGPTDDVEVIVVDDASTDGTADVVRASADPRVRLIALTRNGGAAAARNHALDAARGRWIALLDSDDRYAPERLERMVAAAEREDADLLADDILFVRDGERAPHGSLIRLSGERIDEPTAIDAARFVRMDAYGSRGLRLGLTKPLMRTAFLRRHALRYRDELRLGQDYWLYLECLLHGARFVLLPEGWYHYRARPGSLIRQGKIARLEGYLRAGGEFLARPEVAANAGLADALTAHLADLRRWLAYYRVVEPLKHGRWLAAASAAASNPGFFATAARRWPRAALRRLAPSAERAA